MFDGEVFRFIFIVVFGAVIVESIVNIVRNIEAKNTDWRYWAALGLGLVLGIFVSVNWDIDLFKIAGLEARLPFAGAVLTGLIMSRGANFVNDFWDRLLLYKRE